MIWASGANLKRFASSGFIQLALLKRILKRIMNRARQMNQSRANLLKSAKTIDTKQINNLLTGENLSLFKNSLELFKVESADAHCVSLGFLRLDVKVETHIFLSTLSSLCLKTKSPTVSRCFKFLNLFLLSFLSLIFFTQKVMVPMIPQVLEVPRSADP